MDIVEINTSDTPYLELLIDILSIQMGDIGATKSRSAVESAIHNALKPESRALFFLAMQDNATIGVVFLNVCSGIESGGDYVWINEIQITPDHRGKGYGKELLKHVLVWSKANNYKAVLSMTSTTNNASQALFSSKSFTTEDIKWMSKDL